MIDGVKFWNFVYECLILTDAFIDLNEFCQYYIRTRQLKITCQNLLIYFHDTLPDLHNLNLSPRCVLSIYKHFSSIIEFEKEQIDLLERKFNANISCVDKKIDSFTILLNDSLFVSHFALEEDIINCIYKYAYRGRSVIESVEFWMDMAVELGLPRFHGASLATFVPDIFDTMWSLDITVEKKMSIMQFLNIVLPMKYQKYIELSHKVKISSVSDIVQGWHFLEHEEQVTTNEPCASTDNCATNNPPVGEFYRKKPENKRIKFDLQEEENMWMFLYNKLFDESGNLRDNAEEVSPKGRSVWVEYCQVNNVSKTAGNLASHFRKHMINNIYCSFLRKEPMLKLIKFLNIHVDKDRKDELEKRFLIRINLFNGVLVDWTNQETSDSSETPLLQSSSEPTNGSARNEPAESQASMFVNDYSQDLRTVFARDCSMEEEDSLNTTQSHDENTQPVGSSIVSSTNDGEETCTESQEIEHFLALARQMNS